MKNSKHYLGIAILLVIFGAVGVAWQKPWEAKASVIDGQAYSNSTTTIDTTWGSATTYKVLKHGPGVFGGITVASTSPSVTPGSENNKVSMRCFDSGSTGSTATTTASSTLMVVGDQAAVGPLPDEAVFNAGLICEALPGFKGGYTITWKNQ